MRSLICFLKALFTFPFKLNEVNKMTDTADVKNPVNAEYVPNHESNPEKKSRFSPTLKGALIGAVAGSILPVFGTFSGAIIGGISGKIYEKKCKTHAA